MATLYDAYGQPIDTSLLKQELSGPTITGVRTALAAHPAQNCTPERLAQLLLGAEEGDAESYLELAEEIEEKDLHYRAVLSTRKLQVSGLELTVEAATDQAEDIKAADLLRDFINQDILQPALFDLLDAIGKGYAVCEIVWDTAGRQWFPKQVLWRDPRWFAFEAWEGRIVKLRNAAGLLEALAPAKYITHTHKSKSGVPIRGGLARAASWGYLFKNFDLKAWVLFCEVYGHPLRLGKYDTNANDAEKAVLLRAVRDIAADHAAIVPQSMLVEFIDAKAQGNAAIFEKLAEYLDKQISKMVLGQTGTTDTGSRVGTANAHERVREDIESSDAVQLAASLNRDIVHPLIDLNLGPRQRYPRIRIKRPNQEDIATLVDNVVKLVPLGLRVEASILADKLGLPNPDAGALCLGSAQPPAEELAPEPPHKTAQRVTGEDTSSDKDALDTLTATATDDWEVQLAPLVEPVLALADKCTSVEEFTTALPELIQTQNPEALTEHLAKALFTARLHGMLDNQQGPRHAND